jgi:hypothetical protein
MAVGGNGHAACPLPFDYIPPMGVPFFFCHILPPGDEFFFVTVCVAR